MSYTVALDAFHGPLDLLLYLVKRNEVDILDIPIARIADQFLEYLQVVQDLELAGDFIVMAATLMEIKSRSLVPSGGDEAPPEAADPRRELVRQLLEYRKFKDAAVALEERAEQQGSRVARQDLPDAAPETGPVVKPVELWDLVSAFARLMRETQSLQPATIAVDDTPQHIYEGQIKDRVRAEGRVAFRAVFTPPYSKARLIGIFLAILELIRHRDVRLDQPDPKGELWLVPVEHAESPPEETNPRSDDSPQILQ